MGKAQGKRRLKNGKRWCRRNEGLKENIGFCFLNYPYFSPPAASLVKCEDAILAAICGLLIFNLFSKLVSFNSISSVTLHKEFK